MDMQPYKDLTNKQFGGLTVLEFAYSDGKGKSCWKIRCQCGRIFVTRGNSLSSGNTKSCGCQHRAFMKQALGNGVKDLTGAYYSRLRGNAKSRGISFNVSKEYLSQLFEGQSKTCALSGELILLDAPIGQITASLDRIDSTKGYVEGNVQWVHKKVNLMKNVIPQSEFVDWCRKVVDKSK